MTLGEELWAEVVEIRRLHGEGAVEWLMGQIFEANERNDFERVARLLAVTLHLNAMLDSGAPH